MHNAAAALPGSPTRRPAWTVRAALWSARHRWLIITAWFAFTVGLFAASQGIGGIRTVGTGDASEEAQTESGRAVVAMRSGSDLRASEELNVVITSETLQAADPVVRAVVRSTLERLAAATVELGGSVEPAISDLTDPYAAPPAAGLISPDLSSVRIVGHMNGDTSTLQAKARAIEPVLTAIRHENPGFRIHAYGLSLFAEQIADEINHDLDGALLISLPATFLILFIAFGALVAAGVPLVLAVSALLGAFGIVGLFSQAVAPVSAYATQVIVLVGLAVAVDYSLFVITRFRTERRAGRDRLGAIEAASATAGRAVLFSGVAVMVSLAGLFLLPVAVFQTMAIGVIAVVLMSLIGSLVFLPAALSVLGDGVNRGRIPGRVSRPVRGVASRVVTQVVSRLPSRRRDEAPRQPGEPPVGEGGVWSRVVNAAMRRPVAAALLASAVLLVLASPVTRLRTGESDITVFPETVDGVLAVEALQEHWPQGTLLTLDVVVTDAGEAATRGAIGRLEPALLAVEGLSGPARLATSTDGTVASVSVRMSGTSNDPSNWQIVRRVRAEVVPAVFGELPGVSVSVGGDAAVSLDQAQIYTDGMVRILVFVLGLSFVLLLLVFHSIAIPLKAILLNLLATGAGFGALVLVFQDGWFGSLLGIHSASVIQNFVPIFVFTILFGLSMDYEVFILARIKEAWDQGATSREAVGRGISLTAGTVTSAAAIMVVVFAVFLTLPLGIARQLGLGLGVAVLVDATIIRAVLLPATMRLLGDWNWWMPPFLRWLPRITIEGETDELESAARRQVGAGRAALGSSSR